MLKTSVSITLRNVGDYLLAYFSFALLANLSSKARNSSFSKFCYVQQRNSHRHKSVTRVSEIMSNRRYSYKFPFRGQI